MHVAGLLRRAAQAAPTQDATLYIKAADALASRADGLKAAAPASATASGQTLDIRV